MLTKITVSIINIILFISFCVGLIFIPANWLELVGRFAVAYLLAKLFIPYEGFETFVNKYIIRKKRNVH